MEAFDLTDQVQWEAYMATIQIHAAVSLQDPPVIEEAVKLAEDVRLDTPRLEASILTGKGALAALEGEEALAGALFVNAADIFRELGAPFDLALSQLACASLLESGSEVGKAAAHEAREIFIDLGAQPFLERLDEAVNG